MNAQRIPCREMDPELWFPAGGGLTAAEIYAKSLCRTSCPIRRACLDIALRLGIDYGIFGGYGPAERRQMRRINALPLELDIQPETPQARTEGAPEPSRMG